MKKILVPINPGDPALDPALDEAVRLSTLAETELILLGVIPAMPTYMSAEMPADLFERSRVHVTEALERLAAERSLPASTRVTVRDGHTAHEVLECAQEVRADLIVMASHDPGFSTYLLGSVAAHVVRHAHCSVYVVRTPRT